MWLHTSFLANLKLSAMPETYHSLTDGPWLGCQLLTFQNIPWGWTQTWTRVKFLLIILLPHEGELWKTNFHAQTALPVLLPTLSNPANDTALQKFSRACSVCSLSLQKWSKAILVNFWYYLHPRPAQVTRARSAKWHILQHLNPHSIIMLSTFFLF